ncbi:hypothetical protein WJX73_007916 [Symbiochloris irregularis]|uniref:Uncharacterized protein n=1 Tax=Symbiochloris irregularis TaxID=706552 RepID=A0AAW1P474_9CHLO
MQSSSRGACLSQLLRLANSRSQLAELLPGPPVISLSQQGFCAKADSHASGPLAGIKVLDLGQVVAGNFAGGLLAYFGADVIKVEPPGAGDALRSLRMADATGTSLWWRTYGRNRRCMTLDLRKDAARDIVKQLSSQADALIENFRPGVMEKWGLGPKDLHEELIYARISGYGQTGPKAHLPGYASVCEAYSGFRHINGFPDRPPVRPNISLGDSLAGLHAAFGVVMALFHRQRQSGRAGGQVIDAAITESVFNMLEGCIPEYVAHGHDRPPSGSTISGVVPSSCFATKDGKWAIIGGNGESVYTRLMAAVGRPDMGAQNPTYATNSKRCEVEDVIYQVIGDWVKQRTLSEVLAAMAEARVPSGPIMSIADLYNDQQFQQRSMFQTARPPGGEDEVTIPAMLPVMSETPGSTRWAGPELGHHTNEILTNELGYSQEHIDQLREEGVI